LSQPQAEVDAQDPVAAKWDRGALARHFGEPCDQQGSVNEPRTHSEQGVEWNEKWIYRDPERAGWNRVVLWSRYDLLGVWRVLPDGTAQPEELPEPS